MPVKTKATKALRSSASADPKFGSGLGVTTKGRYGLRLMVALARHSPANAMTLGELSRLLDISEKYLWHVARLLVWADLIRAERGAHGGYRLGRTPEAITLLEIVEALEGPCLMVPADEVNNGAAGLAWREVETALRQKLGSLTLRAILELQDTQTSALNYMI